MRRSRRSLLPGRCRVAWHVFAQQAPDRIASAAAGPAAAAARCRRSRSSSCRTACRSGSSRLHEVPVAQVNLVVLSGTANDPPGKYGVASLTAAMLEEGAGSRSALEIADAIDFLGADLGAASGIDLVRRAAARAGGAARRRAADHGRRRAAADLPERRARAPAPAAADQPAAGARRSADDFVASPSRASSTATAHRYGTPQMGTAETIKTFTADDLRAFYTARVPSGERDAARGRRRHRRQGDAAAREELRRVEGVGRRRPPRSCPPTDAAAGAAGLSRRQAGRAAVADPHRLDRRAAIDARLLPDSGAEHDPRRVVHARA